MSLWAMVLLSAASSTAPFDVQPPSIHLGKNDHATVDFELLGCDGPGQHPRLSVNVGSLGEVTAVSPGHYRAIYTPPNARFPQAALIARFCEGGSDSGVEFVRIPLLGQTALPVMAAPHAQVHVEVGSEVYGPVEADDVGSAAIPTFVPPGATEAVVVSRDPITGMMSQATVAIDLPAYNHMTVAVSPRTVKRGTDTIAQVEVLYDAPPEGLTPDKVHAVPSMGQLYLMNVKGGRFSYRYEPPPDELTGEVQIDVTVDGDQASHAATSIKVLPADPRPARLAVGPRVGFATSLQDLSSARLGVGAWMPFELKKLPLAASVQLAYGSASQEVFDPLGGKAQSSVQIIPVSARLSYELLRGKDFWVHAGGGVLAAYGRFSARAPARPDSEVSQGALTAGPLAFAQAAYAVGPGELYTDLTYAYAQLRGVAFEAQAGGLEVALGYRLDLPR